jgi:hypothetical protein
MSSKKKKRSRGRPRLPGAREPNGQLSRAAAKAVAAAPRQIGSVLSPTHFRDIRIQAVLGLIDPRIRYPAGLMSLMRDRHGRPLISDAQATAGIRFHEIMLAYQRETGFASPNCKAQDVGRANGHPPDIVTEATTLAERERKMALVMLGPEIDAILTDLCVRELPPPYIEMSKYIMALDVATVVFGYSAKKMSRAS